MPPVGASHDTQTTPTGPLPPISVGSEASKLAGGLYDAANQRPLTQNVPGQAEQLAPKEEIIPTNVMPPEPSAVRVPVSTTPPAPATPTPMQPVDAAAAFTPKPIETVNTPPTTSNLAPTPAAPTGYQEPDWSAMEQSTKAGAEPTTPGNESPSAVAYSELKSNNLDTEAVEGSEMRKFYEYAANDPDAMLAIFNGIMKEDDAEKRSEKLRAVGPAIISWIENNMLPH